MVFKRYENIDESWKHGGLAWQVMFDGVDYDVSTKPMCRNCLCDLNSSLKCDECGKQYKVEGSISDAASRASVSLRGAKRRQKYTVIAPQIGEKIAEADIDLQDNEHMNVLLENRKGNEQVVITIGKKGEKQKAQIFVDLAKNEIRHDPTDANPKKFIKRIKLDAGDQVAEKNFIKSETIEQNDEDTLYELDRQEILDDYQDQLEKLQSVIAGRGLSFSGVGMQAQAQLQRKRDRALARLEIKYKRK